MTGYFRKKIPFAGVLLLLCFPRYASAQHFSGMTGSLYSPVIQTATQPASGAAMPYRWGVEIAGMNTFWNNNIVSLSPAKLHWDDLDSIDGNQFFLRGKGKRRGTAQADVHLLNFLFHWPKHEKWVAGAGWNIRSRAFADRLNYDYEDSMTTFSRFLKANALHNPQRGRIVNQQWMEWFVTASTVLRENRYEKLAVGASLKLLKGMSAEVIDMEGIEIYNPTTSKDYSSIAFLSGRYGYSENLEELEDDESTNDGVHTLMDGSPFSLGLDIGFTYTRKKPLFIPGFTHKDPADYNWKLAVSLTDIGRLKYPLGQESRSINGLKGAPGLAYLQQILQSTSSLTAFNDSLAQIAHVQPWEGAFSVSLPTALRINFDKNFDSHFFVNASLVLDASFLNPGVDYKIHTLSHLTVTPRWEIKRIGIYAPLYLNVHGAFMAGAAVRFGPLVAGMHDFGWLFGHKKSGGAYVALVIKSLFRKKEECPVF